MSKASDFFYYNQKHVHTLIGIYVIEKSQNLEKVAVLVVVYWFGQPVYSPVATVDHFWIKGNGNSVAYPVGKVWKINTSKFVGTIWTIELIIESFGKISNSYVPSIPPYPSTRIRGYNKYIFTNPNAFGQKVFDNLNNLLFETVNSKTENTLKLNLNRA